MKNKKNRELMPSGARKIVKVWTCIVMVCLMISMMAVSAFAAESDPVQVVNNLSDFMFGLVRAVGMIMLGFAVVRDRRRDPDACIPISYIRSLRERSS